MWGSCHIGQQVSGGHVTVGAMSQWRVSQWWPCHGVDHVTVGSVSEVTMSLWGPCHSGDVRSHDFTTSKVIKKVCLFSAGCTGDRSSTNVHILERKAAPFYSISVYIFMIIPRIGRDITISFEKSLS